MVTVVKGTAWLVALAADLEGQNPNHKCCLLSGCGWVLPGCQRATDAWQEREGTAACTLTTQEEAKKVTLHRQHHRKIMKTDVN